MGKYVLLITLAVALGITLLAYQGQQTSLETTERQAEREEGVIAREIARSAFNIGVNKLRRDFAGWREDTTGVEYEKGTYDLSASGPSTGPVTLEAVGYYGGAAYRIQADAVRDVEGLDGLGIEGPLSSITANGSKYMISGLDTDPVPPNETADHGSGDGYDGHGIRLSDADAANEAQGEFADDQVVGLDGQGDIIHDQIEADLDALQQEIESSATLTGSDLDGSVGSTDNPAIAAVDGNLELSGDDHIIGAIYVDGNFSMKGNSQVEGIVLVSTGDASVDTGGDLTGDARIFGSLLHSATDTSSIEVAGSVRIQYSSEAIKVLEETLPTVDEATQFRIVRRDGEMISETE